MTTTTTTTRFQFIDRNDDIYVGEAEFDNDGINILRAWRFDSLVSEVFPYEKNFPYALRLQLEQAVRECAMCPPVTPIELPTDWNEFEILDAETTYTVSAKFAALPNIKTDTDRQVYGVSTIRRIVPVEGAYKITATGGFADITKELYRIRLF